MLGITLYKQLRFLIKTTFNDDTFYIIINNNIFIISKWETLSVIQSASAMKNLKSKYKMKLKLHKDNN